MMTLSTITGSRLSNQQIGKTTFTKPEELVRWMGCVQAQDFAGTKWALGCRLNEATDAGIQEDFNAGKFLRTHVLRPTWHLVAPEDLRWMLELTAPRIKAFAAGYCRQLELDEAIFRRSHKALVKALQGGRQLTRKELLPVFRQAKVRADDLRLTHLLMRAELDGIICSGPVAGKQFTYALLDERAPAGKMLQRDEAVGELALRYFRSRGPATMQDFAWWSGLTVADARMGVEMNRSSLEKIEVEEQIYYGTRQMGEGASGAVQMEDRSSAGMYVLPAYDEYCVAYKDRELILPARHALRGGNGIFRPVIIRDGQIVGTWQRTIHKDHIGVETDLFKPVGKRAIKAAFEAYGAFMGKEVIISPKKK